MAASLRAVTHEWTQPEARSRRLADCEGGIDRRDLRRASALVSAGAVAPGWLTSPGIVAAAAGPGREAPVLQSGHRAGRGPLPALDARDRPLGHAAGADSVPAATVESGAIVTVDTISHEGILEDQGRDPVAYFGRYGIAREQRARRRARPGRVRAASTTARASSAARSPCAAPSRATSCAWTCSGSSRACPTASSPTATRAAARTPSRSFTPVRRADDGYRGYLPVSRQLRAEFPLDPYMGIMGVAGDELDVQRGPRRRLEPVPAGAGAGREVLHRRPALRARGRVRARGAAAGDVPAHRPRPRESASRRRASPDYWVARTRLDEPMRRSLRRVARLPRRGARHAAGAGVRAPGRGRGRLL